MNSEKMEKCKPIVINIDDIVFNLFSAIQYTQIIELKQYNNNIPYEFTNAVFILDYTDNEPPPNTISFNIYDDCTFHEFSDEIINLLLIIPSITIIYNNYAVVEALFVYYLMIKFDMTYYDVVDLLDDKYELLTFNSDYMTIIKEYSILQTL